VLFRSSERILECSGPSPFVLKRFNSKETLHSRYPARLDYGKVNVLIPVAVSCQMKKDILNLFRGCSPYVACKSCENCIKLTLIPSLLPKASTITIFPQWRGFLRFARGVLLHQTLAQILVGTVLRASKNVRSLLVLCLENATTAPFSSCSGPWHDHVLLRLFVYD